MDEMHALQEEQRKAGMLLNESAPLRLNIFMALVPTPKTETAAKEKTLAFGAEEEGVRKMKVYRPRRKLRSRARLLGIVSPMGLGHNRQESGTANKTPDPLGELDDDDLVMYVVKHLTDHKCPQNLVEGLEPVLEEEAVEFTIGLWRQFSCIRILQLSIASKEPKGLQSENEKRDFGVSLMDFNS
ncbi:hypothetical protein BJ322DRAFT_1111730 [Thelephora terrestris]|uniref:PWI domain-containing protein n=1 Tax=Thelephora terrestris TaxID=56493 RepID=A0A9P6H8M9_9AGAM|nr:hypothetical protein BJ322DRAFT_1111730 [Thelephora terrestris]